MLTKNSWLSVFEYRPSSVPTRFHGKLAIDRRASTRSGCGNLRSLARKFTSPIGFVPAPLRQVVMLVGSTLERRRGRRAAVRVAVQERDDVARVHVGVLEPHVRRRADEEPDAAADLVVLVAGDVPVEAEARRELERASSECRRCGGRTRESIAALYGMSLRYVLRSKRRPAVMARRGVGVPLILRVERVLQRAEVDVAAVAPE